MSHDVLSGNVIGAYFAGVDRVIILVESFRLVALMVNSMDTPSMVVEIQDMFRDPAPFSVTVRFSGIKGRSGH